MLPRPRWQALTWIKNRRPRPATLGPLAGAYRRASKPRGRSWILDSWNHRTWWPIDASPPRYMPGRDAPPRTLGLPPTHELENLDRLLHAFEARLTHGISPAALSAAGMDWLIHLLNAPGKQLAPGRAGVASANRLRPLCRSPPVGIGGGATGSAGSWRVPLHGSGVAEPAVRSVRPGLPAGRGLVAGGDHGIAWGHGPARAPGRLREPPTARPSHRPIFPGPTPSSSGARRRRPAGTSCGAYPIGWRTRKRDGGTPGGTAAAMSPAATLP